MLNLDPPGNPVWVGVGVEILAPDMIRWDFVHRFCNQVGLPFRLALLAKTTDWGISQTLINAGFPAFATWFINANNFAQLKELDVVCAPKLLKEFGVRCKIECDNPKAFLATLELLSAQIIWSSTEFNFVYTKYDVN